MELNDILTALGQANQLVWAARLEVYEARLEPLHRKLCRVNDYLEKRMQEEMDKALGDVPQVVGYDEESTKMVGNTGLREDQLARWVNSI